jgi:hypothetical protein
MPKDSMKVLKLKAVFKQHIFNRSNNFLFVTELLETLWLKRLDIILKGLCVAIQGI